LAGRKFGEFGESSVNRPTKTMFETSNFAKLYPHQTFPLYSIWQFPAGWTFVQAHHCHLKAT